MPIPTVLKRALTIVIKSVFSPTDSPRARRMTFEFFSGVYRRPALRRSGVLLFGLGAQYIASLHVPLMQPRYYPLSLAIALGSILLFNLPLLLVAERNDWKRRTLERHSHTLDEQAQRAVRESATGFCQRIEDPSDALRHLIGSLRDARGSLYILTPNAVYFRVDQWPANVHEPLTPSVKDRLAILSQHAPEFRTRLTAFHGDLHLIFPDVQDDAVKDSMTKRAEGFHYAEKTFIELNRGAVGWIGKTLIPQRNLDNHSTQLHLSPRSPGFRFMLTPDECYLQELPAGEHGILEPVYKVKRDEHPSWFRLVSDCLRMMGDIT